MYNEPTHANDLVCRFSVGENQGNDVPLSPVLDSLREVGNIVQVLAEQHQRRNTHHRPASKQAEKPADAVILRGIHPGSLCLVVGLDARLGSILGQDDRTTATSFGQLVRGGGFVPAFGAMLRSCDDVSWIPTRCRPFCMHSKGSIIKTCGLLYRPTSYGVTHMWRKLLLHNGLRASRDGPPHDFIIEPFEAISSMRHNLRIRISDAAGGMIYDSDVHKPFVLPPPEHCDDVEVQVYNGYFTIPDDGRRASILTLLQGGELRLPAIVRDRPIPPRTLVQVCGSVPTADGHIPTAMAEVMSLVPVDDSDIELRYVTFDGQRYVADPPLHFVVRFDSEDELFELNGEFGIFFAEPTRSHLLSCLDEVLEMQWRRIAQQPDDQRLTAHAQRLRNEMCQRIQPV